MVSLGRISLRRQAGAYRRARSRSIHPPQPVRMAVELRLSLRRGEIERLADLSERSAPDADWLVADIDGVTVAAISVQDGTTFYDPFRPSLQAVSLLELRRKQVLASAY